MPRLCLLWTTVVVTALLLAVSPAPGTSGTASVASSDWLGQARDQVARAEYHFSPQPDGAFSAPNRAQGLRLRADANGVQLSPRKKDKASWNLGLALRGFGRTGGMVTAGQAEVRAAGERVEQKRRALGMTEWYVNGTRGIEQGYTIDARPAGGEDGSPLLLEIAFSGSLEARQEENGAAVRFATRGDETALLYNGLMAVDASGDRVESTLAIIPGALRISVQDQGHPYPIIVDPTIIVPSWTVFGDQFDERFGASVAGAGDVNGDGFADVLVGAYQYDNGEFDEGAAFLYYGSTTGPSPLPAWTFEPNQTGAWFGYSVASAGDVNGDGYADIIVGAPLYDDLVVDNGRAFVFLGSSTGLGLQPAWTAGINQANARFGSAVASAGDVNGDGIKDVIVGAPLYDNGQNADEGRAFVFLGSFAGLSSTPNWSGGSGLFSSGFGTSVAAAGDVNGDGFGDIIVGAPLYDFGGFFDEGRVFVYFGSASGPSLNPSWTADGNKGIAHFGQSVAGAGDVNGDGFSDVVVGAPRLGTSTNPAEGSVLVYYGGRNGLANQSGFTVTETHANDLFGGSVAGAGDVNGDGVTDIISGGIGLDNAAQFVENSGGAELILGFRTRQNPSPKSSLHGVRFTN